MQLGVFFKDIAKIRTPRTWEIHRFISQRWGFSFVRDNFEQYTRISYIIMEWLCFKTHRFPCVPLKIAGEWMFPRNVVAHGFLCRHQHPTQGFKSQRRVTWHPWQSEWKLIRQFWPTNRLDWWFAMKFRGTIFAAKPMFAMFAAKQNGGDRQEELWLNCLPNWRFHFCVQLATRQF